MPSCRPKVVYDSYMRCYYAVYSYCIDQTNRGVEVSRTIEGFHDSRRAAVEATEQAIKAHQRHTRECEYNQ